MLATAAAAAPTVGRFDPLDLPVVSSRQFANPWRDVTLRATLTHSSGRTFEAAGFYDGEGRWIVRASFDRTGMWSVRTRSEPAYEEFATERQIEVTPNGRGGPLRLDPKRAGFARADGAPFFLAGDTCYPLLGLDRNSQLLGYLEKRAAQGFTLIRWQAAMIETRFPGLWPWGGTREQPDLDRFNPAYFRHMDQVMQDLRARGLQSEIVLLNFYPTGGPMLDPGQWTPPREKAWLNYLIGRYGAFDTVAYWTVANEFETYPDGKYRLDEPSDADWARRTAQYIKSIDPYRHPVTVHPYSGYEKYLAMFGAATEIDFLTLQEHGGETKQSRYLSEGDGAGLEGKVRKARQTGKAVVTAEFGYEWDGSTQRGSNVTSDLQRRQAWRIVLGGGHFSAGFRSSVFNFPEITFDPTNHGQPGGRYMEVLLHYFQRETDFWRLQPTCELCLESDRELVVYAPYGGKVSVDLTRLAGPLIARWLNPLTGDVREAGEFEGGGVRVLESPWAEAVLHVRTPIHVEAPADGGWPRNPDQIRRLAGDRFFVDAAGHNRYVAVDVVNRSSKPRQVSLDGFIDNFGKVRNTKEVSSEQYLYVKPPNGGWQRTYRQGGSLILTVLPGRTKVATVVSFTYADVVRWVESLHDPRVRTDVILSSSNGEYRVYRIRITNPGSRANKLRIAINRTNHAYERSGFFVVQGVVDWLLSGDPAANLDHIEWTLYPTLDPEAIHDGQDYVEYDNLILDDGRKARDALWDATTGELPAARYHVLVDLHMWESRDYESYKYNDPFSPSGRAGNGKSEVERVMLGFWPYWHEFGIDAWDHENKWQTANALPSNFGGALVTHLELPFYGKDDVDPRERLREQGRRLARSESQAYLRMQQTRRYWPAVDTTGARLLPVPEVTLLESHPRTMTLFHEVYDHGVATTAGEVRTYDVSGADTFRAMVGLDDRSPSDAAITFAIDLDGKEVWRSGSLRRFQRELVFLKVQHAARMTLRVAGPHGALANWGGATLTKNDPELIRAR